MRDTFLDTIVLDKFLIITLIIYVCKLSIFTFTKKIGPSEDRPIASVNQ